MNEVPSRLGKLLRTFRHAPRKPEQLKNIDPWAVRSKSLGRAEALGYVVRPELRLIDRPESRRSKDEIVDRILCLHAVSATAKGFDAGQAKEWLASENAIEALSPSEVVMLSNTPNAESVSFWEESIWTLLWVLGVVRRLDFGSEASGDMHFLLPDLKKHESAIELRERERLRQVRVIFQHLDLAFCLQHSVEDANSAHHRIPGDVDPQVILHRRKALEWLIGHDDWDDVRLDT